MKTKLFLFSLCAGLFLLASCSHGPSAATKAKVAAFDSTWTALGVTAKSWKDSLDAATTACETGCKNGDAMECCEHMKASKDSLMMPCKNDLAMFQGMQKEWSGKMQMADSVNAKLAAIKEKVSKGQGTDKEINDGIAQLQMTMDGLSSGFQNWVSKFNEEKMSCMKNAEACKAGWGNMKCTDKKCAMEKKAGEMKETKKKA